MRFKVNPYSKFTSEQQVMGDKAESLGYVWDRVNYPTPAWDISLNINHEKKYNGSGIQLDKWNSEFVLWAIDCAHRVLPIFRGYATRANISDTTTGILELAQGYVLGGPIMKGSHIDKKLKDWIESIWVLYHSEYVYIPMPARNTIYSVYRAATSSINLYNPNNSKELSLWQAKNAASFARAAIEHQDGTAAMDAEEAWQRAALAHRIDAVAPWRLGP